MRHFAEELSILTLPLALDHDNISDEMDTSSDNAVITRNWLKNRLSPQMIDELRQLPSFVRYAFSNPDSAPRFANDDSEGTRTDKLLDFVEVARGLKNEWARNIRAGMIIVSRMMSIWNKRTAEEVLLAMVLESKGDDGLEDLIDDLSRAVLCVLFIIPRCVPLITVREQELGSCKVLDIRSGTSRRSRSPRRSRHFASPSLDGNLRRIDQVASIEGQATYGWTP